jgi:hypothetical protein
MFGVFRVAMQKMHDRVDGIGMRPDVVDGVERVAAPLVAVALGRRPGSRRCDRRATGPAVLNVVLHGLLQAGLHGNLHRRGGEAE